MAGVAGSRSALTSHRLKYKTLVQNLAFIYLLSFNDLQLRNKVILLNFGVFLLLSTSIIT